MLPGFETASQSVWPNRDFTRLLLGRMQVSVKNGLGCTRQAL